jgi:glycosyltransferase involved in cell wall biosynthesis
VIILERYLPGYKAGGPIRSIANLVAALGQEFEFKIVALDRDLGEKTPFPGVTTGQWVNVGNANVMYLRPGLLGGLRAFALLRSIDANTVLYLNSFFARRCSILPIFMCQLRLCRPRCVVIAPRGEFSRAALQLKQTRKRLFIKLSRWLGSYNGLVWHASSSFEAADIRSQFDAAEFIEALPVGGQRGEAESGRKESVVTRASDLLDGSTRSSRDSRSKPAGQLRAVFVARCSQIKNLAGALKMLGRVSGDVSFDIYGPREDPRYWEDCQHLIGALPANVRVHYCGEIGHEHVAAVFAAHDLFLFPTRGENFGHVIGESLLSGCPVLTSDQTPWQGLEALGVGWSLPLSDSERFTAILQQCVDMTPEDHGALRRRAAEFGKSRLNDPSVIEQNRRMFHLAFGR